MSKRMRVVQLATLLLASVAALARPVEQVLYIPMELPRERGVVVELETTVYRPDRPGPFPLVMISHGSPRNPADRKSEPRKRYPKQAEWFVDRGFAVAIPMRRGYANSGGRYAEGYACDDPDYRTAGLSTANDIRAALSWLREQPWIDPDRIVLLGQSAGGFGSLAAASRNPPGVIGVINIAGGRGSQRAGEVCGADRLVEAIGGFGRTARVPSLWLYAANDGYFGPDLAQRMYDAYRAGGAPAEFVQMRAYGRDGHEIFRNDDASDYWTPAVERFLARIDQMFQ